MNLKIINRKFLLTKKNKLILESNNEQKIINTVIKYNKGPNSIGPVQNKVLVTGNIFFMIISLGLLGLFLIMPNIKPIYAVYCAVILVAAHIIFMAFMCYSYSKGPLGGILNQLSLQMTNEQMWNCPYQTGPTSQPIVI